VRRAGLRSPALLVIGNVAALARTDLAGVRAQALTIGVGFRRGVTVDQIDAAVTSALQPHSMADAACVATLDSKADEPGLIAFCRRHGVPLVTFSAQDIQAAFRAHSSLRGSAVVEEHVGVEGVCEPCALLAAPGGTLLYEKRALDGVAVAIAASGPSDRTRTPLVQRQGNDEDRH
jgi:uroporphyrin-III C-methyltransferase